MPHSQSHLLINGWPSLPCLSPYAICSSCCCCYSLALANLVMLLAYCYSCGLVAPGLCYSFLAALQEGGLGEAEVSAMVTLLNAVSGPAGRPANACALACVHACECAGACGHV